MKKKEQSIFKWTIQNRWNYLFAFHDTRRDAIKEALEVSAEETWLMAKRKFGFRAIRVKVIVLDKSK